MSKKKNADNEYVKKLPIVLQQRLQNDDAFINACKNQMIVFEKGMCVSHFKNKSVLSYFCGRCFCGDRLVGRMLIKGKYDMPVKPLEQLFGVERLKESRKKYPNRKISASCVNIGYLFVKLK